MYRLISRGLALIPFLLLFSTVAGLNAQAVELDQYKRERPLFYYLDLTSIRSETPGKSLLQIFIKIPYDELQFVKAGPDSFRAEYEIALAVYQKDFQVSGKTWDSHVTVKRYDDTNSREDYTFNSYSVDVEPGEYTMLLAVTDLETREMSKQRVKIRVQDFYREKMSISDILYADSLTFDLQGNITVFPHVHTPRRRAGSLFGYFYIYTREDNGDYAVTVKIKRARSKKVFEDTRIFQREGVATPVVIAIPDSQLSHGAYSIEIKVKDKRYKATLRDEFTIYWQGRPVTEEDLKLAVRQLRYIANPSDYKRMMKAKGPLRREFFERFWRERDPSPGTERNELLDEYYRRVEYANANFRDMRDGWKSDRGMVYIMLGEPNEVSRDTYPRSYFRSFSGRNVKAWEVWKYYELNRSFLFVDETGFGTYRLENPGDLHGLGISLRR